MARFSRTLPSLARCERPRNALSRSSRDQPGRLAQGPEEKLRLTGRWAGLADVGIMKLSFQIVAPRWGGVSRRRFWRGLWAKSRLGSRASAVAIEGTGGRRWTARLPTPDCRLPHSITFL